MADLRDEVRAWIHANWAAEITVREWWRRLAESGLAQPTWPAPYGRGLSASGARMVTEELAAAGVIAPPVGTVGTTLAGPTLLSHGTPEQQARLLLPMIKGEESWCQLFSEPGSGSDLASLATRAVRDGDDWVVTGQKVWNSGANIAQRGMLLARTDPDVPKHEGITYFVLDMDQPGVDARPLRQMTGEATFCEVFITEARVSDDDVIERPGEGWRVARTTLLHERASVVSRGARGLVSVPSGEAAGFLDRAVGEIVSRGSERQPRLATGSAIPARKLFQLARERGADRDPVLRQRLARYFSLTEISRYTQQRITANAAAGRAPGPEGSITKLFISNICHTSRDLSWAILGPSAMLSGPDAPYGGELATVGLSSFGTSIGGGTDEVQRNLLGERALGLPREPSVDQGVPWSDLLVGTQETR